MDFLLTAEAGLAGLFLASFLAATLLPGGSEAVLLAVLAAHPEQAAAAWALATAGNTLGGMSSYGLGRLLPRHLAPRKSDLARRRGPPVLLLSWVPLIGDALCVAAGWLRLAWPACLFWMALGKGGRYAALVWMMNP